MDWDRSSEPGSDQEPAGSMDMPDDMLEAVSSDDDEEIFQDPPEEESDNEGEVQFDKNLPATHSYLPGGLDVMHGRSFLEAGWKGTVPCMAHHHIAFPGELFPMMIQDLKMFKNIIENHRFFGLICPDDGGFYASQFGTLCEVLEATQNEGNESLDKVIIKSRTCYRFRILDNVKGRMLPIHVHGNPSMVKLRIKILPEIATIDPLNHSGFRSVNYYKCCNDTLLNRKMFKAESFLATVPTFVFKAFDVREIIREVKTYFLFDKNLRDIPEDLTLMSFWVATHISISNKERLKLFKIDNALLRLYLATNHMKKIQHLCCFTCMTEICSRDNYFPMSTEGLTAKYCNMGGHVHDILTVKYAKNIQLQGGRSMEFTWFPGYYWTIAICGSCYHHVGWRFDAEKKSLRPKYFYGLVRNMLVPPRESVENK